MGRIVITDPQGEFAPSVAQALAGQEDMIVEVLDCTDETAVRIADPHVVVVAPSVKPGVGIELAEALDARDGRIGVILVCSEVSTGSMRAAMRAGVSDVLDADFTVDELVDSIREAHAATVAARPQDQELDPAVAEGGRIVTVFSTKGGVGKTVLSTNLGVALANLDRKAALVDLDLQFGDVGIMLGLEPSRTIADVVQSIDRLDADLMAGFMTEHSSGLDVLLAPVRPEDAEMITPHRIARILELLSEMYDVVIVDTAATFDEVVLTALDKSTDIYPITMMDIASIKNTKISLQKLSQLGYGNGSLHLVLNRADSKVLLQPAEVESAVGASIYARIPSDRLVPRSVNKGTPVVIEEPRSRVSKVIVEVASEVANSTERVTSDVT